MKKIFAIALALVMVLSMTAAFASPCTAGFDWTTTTTTNCGQGKVEVVPYIRVNNGCGGYSWEVSTCAGAVTEENVYYAVKLTVDAYPDAEWWAAAHLEFDYEGLNATDNLNVAAPTVDTTEDEAVVYYRTTAGGWAEVDEAFTFGDAHIMTQEVTDARKAKVCVTLESGKEDFVFGIVGDYLVIYHDNTDLEVWSDWANAGGELLVEWEILNGKVNDVHYTQACGQAGYETIKAFFGIDINTKINQDLVDANFGWESEVKSCFSWSDKVSAIVDAECVVAIPKTGDASVLAWLF